MLVNGIICTVLGLTSIPISIHYLVNKDKKIAVLFLYTAICLAMFGTWSLSVGV